MENLIDYSQLSDNCQVAYPTKDGKDDYTGFCKFLDHLPYPSNIALIFQIKDKENIFVLDRNGIGFNFCLCKPGLYDPGTATLDTSKIQFVYPESNLKKETSDKVLYELQKCKISVQLSYLKEYQSLYNQNLNKNLKESIELAAIVCRNKIAKFVKEMKNISEISICVI